MLERQWWTSVRYFGNQKRMNCQTGSVRKRIPSNNSTGVERNAFHQRKASPASFAESSGAFSDSGVR
jgi:hypothetical protein